MVVTGALGLTSGGAAVADSNPGVGSSYAQGIQVTPHDGSLAVGAVFDEALAGHTDQIAKAQSQGLDLGAVGTSIKGYNCGQPPSKLADYVPTPIVAETPEGGGTDQASAGPSPTDNNSDGSVEQVSANSAPYGEANTTLAGPLNVANNFIGISGVASRAWSGIVKGSRDAGATVDIGALTIAGTVSLSHLHWQADYPATGSPTSSFTIGQAAIAGNAVPTADPSALATAINTALSNVGVAISFPTKTTAPPSQYNPSGIQFEGPLQIEVLGGSARDQVGNPLVNAIHQNEYAPVSALENGFAGASSPYNSLAPLEQNDPTAPLEANNSGYYGLQWALCNSDTPVTVADVTMASFTSGGYFNIGLGGVNASSGPLPDNQFNLAEFNFAGLSSASADQFMPGSTGTPSIGGTPAIAGTPGQSISGSTPQGATSSPRSQRVVAADVSKEAAGPLLGIGIGVLGLLGLLAEADRRMIRRNFNHASFEE